MIYPQSFEQKIGFDAIRRMLTAECISPMGAERSEAMHFISNFSQLKLSLEQSNEMKRVLMLEKAIPSQDYLDLRTELKRLRIKGSFITLEGLKALSISYTVFCELRQYLLSLEAETYPLLHQLVTDSEVVEDLPRRMGAILDPITHEMRDNASEELYRIRSRIGKMQSESHRQIQKYLSAARKEGWTGDNAEATVRGDRLVIPMLSAYKRQIRGFIHDVSSSGQTVFLEPEEVFNLNNELTELRNEERMEMIRILKDFSLSLYPMLPVLLKTYEFLGCIDFLRAKAKIALHLKAGMPILESEPVFTWRYARHPLLKDPVPLDFCLQAEERIVIISGPNAGGKSVCLKTVGLLQYMLQCGLLVPMLETSEMGIFQHIFVDIGDEQSIENDLSTYSSHLKNMKFWLENADQHTLFLADELGSGTEPQVGGAIAEALLEEMEKKRAWGVITTHYTHLKLLAKRHPSMVNGAMLFNKEEMRPLYIFKKGLPGSSFAFEMARKIGLSAQLLASAQAKTGQQHLQFEEELQQIEVEKQKLQKQLQEVNAADRLLSSTLEKYNKLTLELESSRSEILKKAKLEAQNLILSVNQRIEHTIREIREAQAEKETTKAIRQQFQAEIAELKPKNSLQEKPEKPKMATKPVGPILIGHYVRRIHGKETGLVIEMKGNKAKVDFDFIKIEIPLDQLTCLSQQELKQEKEKQSRVQVKIENLQEGRNEFMPYLDVRGMKAEEATQRVQKLVDKAILYGEKRLEILHGKGYGILKENIRECLCKNPHVASFYNPKEEMGGAGITIIEIN